MKKMLKTLAGLLHGNWIVTVSALVVTVMVAVVVVNGAGEDSRFTPDTTNALSYYGTPEAEGITYNLSEDDQSGKDINQNSDREREQEEPETENTLGNDEQVILPSDMANSGGQPTVDAPVDNTLGGGNNPGYDPNQPGGFNPGGNNPGGNPGGEVVNPKPERPSGNKPSGGDNSGGNTPGGNKVTVGGKEYDSIDDALADIADNQDKDKNDQGQYFEGFVKDENGNYVRDENGNLIPSYSDKFDNGADGDVSQDYTGDSGIYVVPSVTAILDMDFISSRSFHTIVIPKQTTGIKLPEFGMEGSQLATIIVSKDNKNYKAEDGVLYDIAGETLLLCPPAKKSIGKFPAALQTVGTGAFAYSVLEELELPDTVTTIGSTAFANSYIKKIVLPDSVETIGDNAFMAPTVGEDEEGFQRIIVLQGKTPPVASSNVFNYINNEKIDTHFVIDSASRAVYEHYLATWGMTIAGHRLYDGEQALNMLQTADNLQEEYIYDSERQGFVEKASGRLIAWSDENAIYRLDENGNIVLVKWIAASGFVDLTKLKTPFAIDAGAFDECFMKSIRIPAEVTEMPENIFAGCNQLRAIISYAAAPFAEELGAPEIASVFVKPESEAAYQRAWGDQVRKILATSETYTVTTLGLVFDSANSRLLDAPLDIETVNIPSYVTHIYEGALQDHKSLTDVTGGTKLKSVGREAFAGCTALRSMALGATVTEIGESAFEGCTALTKVSSDSNQYVYLQGNVQSVGAKAFRNCTSLRQVYWYGKVAEIPESCFEGCGSLVWFTYLDNALTGIGESAFEGCRSLSSCSTSYQHPYLWVQGSVKSMGARAFKDCASLVTVSYYSDAVAEACFAGCTSLNTVYWYYNNAVEIPNAFFEGCSSFVNFAWGDAGIRVVRRIGDRAFYGCGKLATVLPNYSNMPEYFANLTTIGNQAFYGCKAMTTAYIAPSVSAIGDNAFGGRGGAALTVTMAGLTPPFMGAVDSLANLTIYVPDSEEHAVYGAYRTAWESWLGEHPEQVLKTLNGAENLWEQPEPDPEPTEPDNPEDNEGSDDTENGDENGDNGESNADDSADNGDPVNQDEAVQPVKPEDSGEGEDESEDNEEPQPDGGQDTEITTEEI